MVMQRVMPSFVHASQEPIRSAVANPHATPASISKFGRVSLARFACFVLVYNIAVIVWGAYVRATGSGAGCGSHWPLCNGEFLPATPQTQTVIEFTHRVTSGLSLVLVSILLIWCWRRTAKSDWSRYADRAATVLTAIDPSTKPSDLVRPGHVFPLRARSAGVLARAGQTEAAVDLARLAGLHPSGVICEIMNKDGTMARVPQLSRFARRRNVPMVTVADLITYRMRTESVVKRVASTKLPTEYGEFRLHAFENQIDKQTHVALVCGEVGDGRDVLVRVHSQCLTGDVLRSARCDC